MKASLNIENDAELRAYIKDAIKGQVLSIVREELLDIIIDELNRKIKGMEVRKFDRMVNEAIEKSILDIIRSDLQIDTWSTKWVEPIIGKCVNKTLEGKDFNKLVDDAAREKVRKLIQ